MRGNLATLDSQLLTARAAYEDAFRTLADEVAQLQSLPAPASPGAAGAGEARARVDAAHAVYIQRRDQFAELLLARQVSQSPVESDEERLQKVRELAHLLWERSGHVDGDADHYWYRAERLIQMLDHKAA